MDTLIAMTFTRNITLNVDKKTTQYIELVFMYSLCVSIGVFAHCDR